MAEFETKRALCFANGEIKQKKTLSVCVLICMKRQWRQFKGIRGKCVWGTSLPATSVPLRNIFSESPSRSDTLLYHQKKWSGGIKRYTKESIICLIWTKFSFKLKNCLVMYQWIMVIEVCVILINITKNLTNDVVLVELSCKIDWHPLFSENYTGTLIWPIISHKKDASRFSWNESFYSQSDW